MGLKIREVINITMLFGILILMNSKFNKISEEESIINRKLMEVNTYRAAHGKPLLDSYPEDENFDPIDRILKRQLERKKAEEKNNVEPSNFEEIEKFIEDFNEKQKEIEKDLDLTDTLDQDKLFHHFSKLNEKIQELQRFYSNATLFLRIYDKKICQNTLHTLQLKLKDLEGHFLPKKKFGFKNRTNKAENSSTKNGLKTKSAIMKNDKFIAEEVCGFCRRDNEILILKGEEIDKKDILLADITNCSIKLYGNPSTVHITNLKSCQIYSGPVTTSVFVEKVKDSSLHLACQQLRIHDTNNSNFFVHVTSKAIIEDSKEVKFGEYKLNYEGIEEHYKMSGLNKDINNWDKIDDFNWLATDKPSPNWSVIICN